LPVLLYYDWNEDLQGIVDIDTNGFQNTTASSFETRPTQLVLDQMGVGWFAVEDVLTRYDNGIVTTSACPFLSGGEKFKNLTVDRDSGIWLITNAGKLIQFESDSFQLMWDASMSFQSGPKVDSSNGVWLLNNHAVLFRYSVVKEAAYPRPFFDRIFIQRSKKSFFIPSDLSSLLCCAIASSSVTGSDCAI
jgi:ligand-binding sensor domain-containing protein